MEGFAPRSLVLLLVTAAVVTAATPAAAQVYKRTAPDGTTYFTNVQPNPSYQRAAYTPAPTRVAQRPSSADYGAYSQEIAEAAARYAVPERLIWAVIRVESGFDHRAVSRKGARGLMQLMPETAAILGVRDSFNPRENIHAGARHLRALMERFGYDLPLAIAAYNPAISRDPGVRGAGAAPLRRADHVGVAGQRYSADRRAQRQRCLHERRASAAQRRGPPGTIESARAAKRSEDGTRSATLQEEATGPRDCGSKRRRREPPPPRGS